MFKMSKECSRCRCINVVSCPKQVTTHPCPPGETGASLVSNFKRSRSVEDILGKAVFVSPGPDSRTAGGSNGPFFDRWHPPKKTRGRRRRKRPGAKQTSKKNNNKRKKRRRRQVFLNSGEVFNAAMYFVACGMFGFSSVLIYAAANIMLTLASKGLLEPAKWFCWKLANIYST